MFDFLVAPAVVGLIGYFFYKIVQTIACRKERLVYIEKWAEVHMSDPSRVPAPIDYPLSQDLVVAKSIASKFTSLRIGSVMFGMGFGLLIAYIITMLSINSLNGLSGSGRWELYHALISAVWGGSVLTFGGLGLLVSYIIERKNIISADSKK